MKKTFLLLSLLVASQVYANVENDGLNQKILTSYYGAIDTYAEFVKLCDEKKAPVLPENLFEHFNLTELEMQTVFNFYRSKTFVKCTTEGLNNYTLHATMLKVKTQTEHATQMVAASDELITHSYLLYLENELKYEKLSQSVKDKVEQVPELQTLFNAMDSFENLSKTYLKSTK